MDLQPGSVIRNPRNREYTLIRKLGEGSFGQVWQARSWRGHDVAIKVILSTTTSRKEFEDEVRLLQGLKYRKECPMHVVCVEGAWVDDKAFYLVTDFLPGTDLRKYIQDVQKGRIESDPNDLFGIMDQIVEGVKWIHHQGMAHNDLKPGNIQINPSANGGIPKATILDLGLACFMPKSGKDPACKRRAGGTAPYMASEVWKRNIEYPKSVDIFALGAIFFFIATGKRLFPGQDEKEIEDNILMDRPRPVDTGDKRLDRLILSMTEPKPQLRPRIEKVQGFLNSIQDPGYLRVLP